MFSSVMCDPDASDTMLLLSISSFMELLNLRRLSYHVWAKKMSMVYSCDAHISRQQKAQQAEEAHQSKR